MKSFAIPVFGCRIYFTQESDNAETWLQKRGFSDSLYGIDGLCTALSGEILVYVAKDEDGLLAHECYHAACRVLEAVGAEHDEETAAHLLQYIVDHCSN